MTELLERILRIGFLKRPAYIRSRRKTGYPKERSSVGDPVATVASTTVWGGSTYSERQSSQRQKFYLLIMF